MKVVAISRILDEADIVEAFVRHTATYVDHHLFIDNGSRDGTVEILQALQNEGFGITVYQNCAVSFSEQSFGTSMYQMAVADHAADWVFCLDCDEFIDDSSMPAGLLNYLQDVHADPTAKHSVLLPWIFYEYTSRDNAAEPVVPRRIINRRTNKHDQKIFVNARIGLDGVVIYDGSHNIRINGQVPSDSVILEDAWLAHFAERSPFQLLAKAAKGWVKVKAAGKEVEDRGTSYHYKEPFECLRDRPHDLLRSEHFMHRKNDQNDLVAAPMAYRGGDLRYTPQVDAAMLAIRRMASYLEDLGARHGALIDYVPGVAEYVDHQNSLRKKLF